MGEGWVTVKGNAGTTYAQESKRHYALLRDSTIRKNSVDESSQIRQLAKGEVVEATGEPKEEKVEDVIRIKGRCLSDGSVGWMTMKGQEMVAWTPNYKCLSAPVIQDALGVKSAKTIRKTEVGEIIELVAGPEEDKTVGAMRIRGRAQKDGVVGWITI